MRLVFRSLFAVGIGVLFFASLPAEAQKNFNSSKSNTSSVNYPDNLEDCQSAGGTAMIKSTDGFCIMELNVSGR